MGFSHEWPRQTKPKKGQFMNFLQGHSGTKVQCESCLFPKGKHQNSHKNGPNSYELFVLGLSLVWFARATPDFRVRGFRNCTEGLQKHHLRGMEPPQRTFAAPKRILGAQNANPGSNRNIQIRNLAVTNRFNTFISATDPHLF